MLGIRSALLLAPATQQRPASVIVRLRGPTASAAPQHRNADDAGPGSPSKMGSTRSAPGFAPWPDDTLSLPAHSPTAARRP